MSNSLLSHKPHPSHHHAHRHRLAYPSIYPPACKRVSPPPPSFAPNPRPPQYDNSRSRIEKLSQNNNNGNSGSSTDNDFSLNTVSCPSTIVDTPPTIDTDNKNNSVFNIINNTSKGKGKGAYDAQGGVSLASSVATTACSSIMTDDYIDDDFALPILKELNTLDSSLVQLFSEPPNPNFGSIIIDIFSANKSISTNGHEVLILYRGKLARRVSRYSHLLKTFSSKIQTTYNHNNNDSINSSINVAVECSHIVKNTIYSGSSSDSSSNIISSSVGMYMDAYEKHALRLQTYKSKLSSWWSRTERQFHTLRMSSFVTQVEQSNKPQCDDTQSSLEQSEKARNINRESSTQLNKLNINISKNNNINNNANISNNFSNISQCAHNIHNGKINTRPNSEIKGRTPSGFGASKILNRPAPLRGHLPLLPGAVGLGVGASTNWVRGMAVRKSKLNGSSNLGGDGGVSQVSGWSSENYMGNV